MAKWTNAVITDLGKALENKVISGETIEITRVTAGQGNVAVYDLRNQTSLVNEKQTLSITKSKSDNDVTTISVLLTVSDLEESYNLQQIGFYANDPDNGEILFAIAQAETATVLPSKDEMPLYSINFDFYFVIANDIGMSVTVDKSAFATVKMLEEEYNTASELVAEEKEAREKADKALQKNIDENAEYVEIEFEKIKSLKDITSTTDTTLPNSYAGGIKINEVQGNTHKSANLLKPTLQTTTTNGVTCTANGDGTYTLNGTASENTHFTLLENTNLKELYLNLAGKKIKLLGCKNGKSTTFRVSTWISDGVGSYIDYGSGVDFEIPSTINDCNIAITVISGYTCNNVIFKPMLVDASIYPDATYDDYEPYGIFSSGDYGLVDLGSLTWETADVYKKASLPSAKKPSNNSEVAKIISENYNVVARNSASSTGDICLTDGGNILVRTTEKPSGYLAYEVADGATPSQYALVVNEHGKNLLNPTLETATQNGITFTKNDDGTYSLSGSRTDTSNDAYITILRNMPLKKGIYKLIGAVDENNSIRGIVYKPSGTINIYDYGNGAILNVNETGTTITVMIITKDDTSKTRIIKPMLTANLTATYDDYEPYKSNTAFIPLSEPLRGIGDVKDTIDVDNKQIIRRVGSVDLGSLEWNYNDTHKIFQGSDIPNKSITKGFCVNYTVTANRYSAIGDKELSLNNVGYTSSSAILVKDTSYTDATAFKTAMSGVMLYYELATPIIEPLTTEQIEALHSLKSYDGTTYIDVVGEVKPIIDLEYGTSKVGALALQNYNEIETAKKSIIENSSNITDLQNRTSSIETEIVNIKKDMHTFTRDVLWENSDPTASIDEATTLVSVPLEDYNKYEFFLITYYESTASAYPTKQLLIARSAEYGKGTNARLEGIIKEGTTYHYHERTIAYSYDSEEFKAATCTYLDVTCKANLAPDKLIPAQIIGIK